MICRLSRDSLDKNTGRHTRTPVEAIVWWESLKTPLERATRQEILDKLGLSRIIGYLILEEELPSTKIARTFQSNSLTTRCYLPRPTLENLVYPSSKNTGYNRDVYLRGLNNDLETISRRGRDRRLFCTTNSRDHARLRIPVFARRVGSLFLQKCLTNDGRNV